MRIPIPRLAAAAAAFLLAPLSGPASDAAAGPPQGVMRYKMVAVDPQPWIDPKSREAVARLIDRIVAAGFNAISIGTYKFMPMYFVDYGLTPYPEAREYDAARVARNVATLRANIRLAKSKGIRLFVSRSYQHYAPYRFWKAHQAELNPGGLFTPLLEKAHQNDIYFNTLAGRDSIIPQQQWNNPVFRNFFLDSTGRMLDALPELDGFLNAYAEAAWTYDPAKLRQNTWKSWKEAVDPKATEACFVDYTDSLYRLLKAKRGDRAFFGLRDWYITPAMLARVHVPRKDLVISVKYAGFDQPLVNYPPWGEAMLRDGYSVILDIHEFDAEHPHPIYWYGWNIIPPTFRHIYAAGFSGICYQGFAGRLNGPEDPIRLLTNRAVAAALGGRTFSQQDAVDFLRPYYGAGSADLLESLERVSDAQAALIKLCPAWFWQGDGLTPGGPQTLQFWQLMDNPDAPPGMAFVRQGVIGVKDYVTAVLSGPEGLRAKEAAWKAAGHPTPEAVIGLMLADADKAIRDAVRARAEVPKDAPLMQDLVASAFIHREMVRRDVAFLRAAIAFYESGAEFDGKYDKVAKLHPSPMDRKDACIAQLEESIGRDQMLKILCLHFAPRRPKTREKPGYLYYKRIASILGRELVVAPADPAEFARLSRLITGK